MANDGLRRDSELAAFVPLLALVLLGAAHELGARQTDAYLGPGLSTPRWLASSVLLVSLLLGALLGAYAALRSAERVRLLVQLCAGLSVCCSASAAFWFWAFQTPSALPAVAIGLPTVGGLLSGAALAVLWRAAGLSYRELGSLRFLLSPLPLGAALLLVIAGALALSYAGLWRAGAGFGLVIAALSLAVRRFGQYLDESRLPRRASWTALGLGVASLATAQAFVPGVLLASYPAEVVWSSADQEQVVISAQNTFELFEARQLRLTSADAYRLAELAVHPALSSSRRRARVLLLGPAGGFLEREILKYRDVEELVSLSESDGASFRQSLWARSGEADARLRWVTAEPLPWLEREQQRYDFILVSLPMPTSYAEGKHYTVYFYELLGRHLAPGGALVVQAGSLAALPSTFATVQGSLNAAGLTSTAYEAPVPLLGAVSFLVAGHQPPSFEKPQLPPGLRFVDTPAVERALALGRAPSVPGDISTLDSQRAVETWHHEQTALGN